MDQKTQKELLEIVKYNYEEIAGDFDETRKKAMWPEILKLTNDISINDSVLDVGCGNGRLLEVLKERGVKYLGVDASENLIGICRKRYLDYKFEISNILNLSQISEINFDYVFCVAVLHHLPGQNLQIDALKQLKNKIKNEGRIILTVWNLWSHEKYRALIHKFIFLKIIGKNKMDIGDIVFDWKKADGYTVSKRYYHAFNKRELKTICKASGLKIEKLYKDSDNYYLVLKK